MANESKNIILGKEKVIQKQQVKQSFTQWLWSWIKQLFKH